LKDHHLKKLSRKFQDNSKKLKKKKKMNKIMKMQANHSLKDLKITIDDIGYEADQ